MPSKDPDKARSRLISAVSRIMQGLVLEHDRIEQARKDAPRLLEGTEYEVVNLTGQPDNDLDYFAYELGRLQDAARTTLKVFDQPHVIADALARFENAIPKLRKARNPLTHPSDDDRLDSFAWFSTLVELGPFGGVETLIDPRSHLAPAEELGKALLDYLRQGLRRTTPAP